MPPSRPSRRPRRAGRSRRRPACCCRSRSRRRLVDERDDRRVDVAELGELRRDPDRADARTPRRPRCRSRTAPCRSRGSSCRGRSPGAACVLERRRRRVAARDPDEMHVADRADATASRTERWAGSKRRLKPTWKRTPAAFDGGECAVDLGEIERHRLLAEDRLARPRLRRRSASTWVSVLVQIATASTSGRAEQVGRARRHRDAEAGRRLHGPSRVPRRNGRERGARDAPEQELRVHSPDPAGAEQTDAHGCAAGAHQPTRWRRLPSSSRVVRGRRPRPVRTTSGTPTSQNAPPGVQRFGAVSIAMTVVRSVDRARGRTPPRAPRSSSPPRRRSRATVRARPSRPDAVRRRSFRACC